MSITTWPQLLEQLTRLIDGEDVTVSEVSPATLTQIIALGERRIYRELRHRLNEKAFASVTVTNNLAPIPVDFESTSVLHFGGYPLTPVAEKVIQDRLQWQWGGDTRYFAEAGANFTFWPSVANGTAVQGRYFCRLPDLNATTLPANALFLAETDLFLYGFLSQAAPFFGQDTRIPMWEARYVGIRDALNEAKNRAAYSAGRIQRRASIPVLR
ncbi:MAG: hypothetical protein V4792_09735 [Pseudomonadota bacterium]